jgi:hypothetical protein
MSVVRLMKNRYSSAKRIKVREREKDGEIKTFAACHKCCGRDVTFLHTALISLTLAINSSIGENNGP